MARFSLNAVTTLVLIFLIGPLVVVAFGSLSDTKYIAFPPEGLTLHWYREILRHDDLIDAFAVSLIVGGATSVLAGGLGAIAAVALSARDAFAPDKLRGFIVSPLVLPTVVTGVALFGFFRRVDLESGYLALVIGHTLITIPYVVRTVGAALVALDPSLAEAAASLGAGWLRIMSAIVLPSIAPAVLVSVLLVFIISFDQVTVSIFLATPDTTPLPVRIYSYLEFGLDPMVAATSTLMILFAYALVIVLEQLFGLNRLFAKG